MKSSVPLVVPGHGKPSRAIATPYLDTITWTFSERTVCPECIPSSRPFLGWVYDHSSRSVLYQCNSTSVSHAAWSTGSEESLADEF